jgi:shikimate dehydrogenase
VTQFISIIGYPLKHTVSPAFQQAALDYHHLDVRYEVWEIEAENLPSAINKLRQPQSLGANITIPYKETALHFLDEVDDFAGFAGAVNTIVNRDGRLVGFNTDGYGFIKALCDDAKFEPKNKRVVIIGAGGAARGVSFALLCEKVNSLVISNRTLARAESLVYALTKYAVAKGIHVEVIASPCHGSTFQKAVQNCHLIVNCTTVGTKYSAQEEQSPLAANLISKGALVYDLVYNPSETPLLRMAKEAGTNIIGGLPMLVYQGAASFELWMGRAAPVDIMLAAARQAVL